MNATKTPPNVTKNIPKEDSSGADSGRRVRDCVVKAELVGPTEETIVPVRLTEPTLIALVGCTEACIVTADAKDILFVAERKLLRFGEMTVLTLLIVAVQFEHHGGLEGTLVIVEDVNGKLELSRPVIKVIKSRQIQLPINRRTKFEF